LSVTAALDPTGTRVVNLQARLSLGLDWLFESGPVNFPVVAGFATLPSSVPMSLVSPGLPIPAGPRNLLETFSTTTPPMTISTQVAIGQTITTAIASMSLLFNGNPGFPISPGAGSYEASLQLSTLGGQEVFCFDQTLADVAFASAAAVSIPTLSSGAFGALAVLLAVAGFLVLRCHLP
jgi:hypothetical protein